MSTTLEELEKLKTDIENLTSTNQIEILRIFNDAGIKLNTSKFGVYVNLTPLSIELLDKIRKKVDFIVDREQTLLDFESKTAEYKTAIGLDKQEKELSFPIRVEE